MSLSSLMNRQCLIVRRSAESDEFYATRDETVIETVCEFQPGGSVTSQGRGEKVGDLSQTSWNAFFPAGTELSEVDAVIIDGEEFEVIGEPWKANSGTSAVHHVYALLRRAQGIAVS